MSRRYKPRGWRNEPHRHALAAKGIKTAHDHEFYSRKNYSAPKERRDLVIEYVGEDQSGMDQEVISVKVPTNLKERYMQAVKKGGEAKKRAQQAIQQYAQRAGQELREESPAIDWENVGRKAERKPNIKGVSRIRFTDTSDPKADETVVELDIPLPDAPTREDVQQFGREFAEGVRKRGQELKAAEQAVEQKVGKKLEERRKLKKVQREEREDTKSERERLQELKEREEELSKTLEDRGIGFDFEDDKPGFLQRVKKGATQKFKDVRESIGASPVEKRVLERKRADRERKRLREQEKEEQRRIQLMEEKLGLERAPAKTIRRERVRDL